MSDELSDAQKRAKEVVMSQVTNALKATLQGAGLGGSFVSAMDIAAIAQAAKNESKREIKVVVISKVIGLSCPALAPFARGIARLFVDRMDPPESPEGTGELAVLPKPPRPPSGAGALSVGGSIRHGRATCA